MRQEKQADTRNLTLAELDFCIYLFLPPPVLFAPRPPQYPQHLLFIYKPPNPRGLSPNPSQPHRPRRAPAPRAGPAEPPRVARPRASLKPVPPQRAGAWRNPPGAGAGDEDGDGGAAPHL